MKPKKIAILYSGAKTWGGIETYLENLFKHADSAKVELELFSLGDWPLLDRVRKRKGNVQVFPKDRINLFTIYGIAKQLRSGYFSLVVSQGTVANAYARLASLLSGVPNLVTVHSEKSADYPNKFIQAIYKTSDLVSRWRTKKYIVVSEYLKTQTLSLGIASRKIEVIYNGVEAPEILPVKKANKRIMIGSVGRLHPVKNYLALVQAMGQLSKDGCDLTIWGEGEERVKLEEAIKSSVPKLTDNVSLPGHASDVWAALSGVDIYVQPSFSEGFGLTVVEAQMVGLPVVVTPGGSLLELVTDGQTGVIAKGFTARDIEAAVSRYLDDPALAERCALSGQKSARERFEIHAWVKKTLDAYLGAAK